MGTARGSTRVTGQVRARAAASDRTVANLMAWATTGAPSPSWLTRSDRSSAVNVPEYPWSASQFSSPHVAGSRSRWLIAPQPTTRVASRYDPPGTYSAGFATVVVSATDAIRDSGTTSVVVVACG